MKAILFHKDEDEKRQVIELLNNRVELTYKKLYGLENNTPILMTEQLGNYEGIKGIEYFVKTVLER